MLVFYRRPETGPRPQQSDSDKQDQLNTEFLALTREADQLHASLVSTDPDKDDVTVRNRLTNVQVRISDVQKRWGDVQ